MSAYFLKVMGKNCVTSSIKWWQLFGEKCQYSPKNPIFAKNYNFHLKNRIFERGGDIK